MKPLIPLSIFLSALAPSSPSGAIIPHPDRPYRLLDTRGEYSVEYPEGHEVYAEAAFTSMKEWAAESSSIRQNAESNVGSIGPLTYMDMRKRKTEFIGSIARNIGFDQPTELMIETYDHFVDTYEQTAILQHYLYNLAWEEAAIKRTVIWTRDDLEARLKAGEKIPRFAYDETESRPTYHGGMEFSGSKMYISDRFEELSERRRNRNIKGTLQFNQTIDWKDGETNKSGSASASVSPKGIPNLLEQASKVSEEPEEEEPNTPNFLPLVIKTEDLTKDPKDYVQENLKANAAYWMQAVSNLPYKAEAHAKGSTVRMILHESAEVGLMETYMNNPRRSRAALDGTAEYVSWRVVSELVDPDIVKEMFHYAAQAKEFAHLRDQLDLGFWIASESQDPKEKGTDLQRARYLFSTLTFLLIAKQAGENAVTEIWLEVGTTSSRRASIMTLNSACRKVTGRFFLDFLEEAETTPVEELIQILELEPS